MSATIKTAYVDWMCIVFFIMNVASVNRTYMLLDIFFSVFHLNIQSRTVWFKLSHAAFVIVC